MTDEFEYNTENIQPDPIDTIVRPDPKHFSTELTYLLRESEDMRLRYMKQHRFQKNVALTLGLLSIALGAGGFGWFLLVQVDLLRALACIVLAIVIPVALTIKTGNALRAYTRVYKTEFLPRIATAIGGLTFHQNRGVKEALAKQSGLLPAYEIYKAEDCFMGTYKGVNILFSEARLLMKNTLENPVFTGVFVLLELSRPLITGHTILTTDRALYNKGRTTRWKKLQDVPLSPDVTDDPARFHVLSSAPESVPLLLGKKLLMELEDIIEGFNNAPLSAAFFQEKYIFLMIPCARNLFEPSNIHIPVNTSRQALACKREVEQLLQIVDILELYRTSASDPAPTEGP